MSFFNRVKNNVTETIRKNGLNEITDYILKNAVQLIVSALNNDRHFAGIINPDSTVEEFDSDVFLILSGAGLYFGGSILIKDNDVHFAYNDVDQITGATIWRLFEENPDKLGIVDATMSTSTNTYIITDLSKTERTLTIKKLNTSTNQFETLHTFNEPNPQSIKRYSTTDGSTTIKIIIDWSFNNEQTLPVEITKVVSSSNTSSVDLIRENIANKKSSIDAKTGQITTLKNQIQDLLNEMNSEMDPLVADSIRDKMNTATGDSNGINTDISSKETLYASGGSRISSKATLIGLINDAQMIIGDEGLTYDDKTGLEKAIYYLEQQLDGDGYTTLGKYDLWYGIEWRENVSSPFTAESSDQGVMRIGNMLYHSTLPIQSQMKGCLLLDNGEVNYYLDPNDWTKKEDGSDSCLSGEDGMVMVELPECYYRFESFTTTDGTNTFVVNRCKLSQYPLFGFRKWEKMYVSAYEATIDRSQSTAKLASVSFYEHMDSNCVDFVSTEWMNKAKNFRGGASDSATSKASSSAMTSRDTADNTLLGRPASGTGISVDQCRTKARARGTGWEQYTYSCHLRISWFFYVEYATFQAQQAFVQYSNPYNKRGILHTGGLGDGVTNFGDSNWSSFSGYYAFVPCGYTNSIGNGTGVKSYTPQGNSTTVSVPRYRGIEHPFGHLFKWSDGILRGSYDTYSILLFTEDRTSFTSSLATALTSYINAGRMYFGSNGWTKKLVLDEYGHLLPKVSGLGGSNNTYMCDYHYTNSGSQAGESRSVAFGGAATYGSFAGFACAAVYLAPSISGANYGSRLCHL